MCNQFSLGCQMNMRTNVVGQMRSHNITTNEMTAYWLSNCVLACYSNLCLNLKHFCIIIYIRDQVMGESEQISQIWALLNRPKHFSLAICRVPFKESLGHMFDIELHAIICYLFYFSNSSLLRRGFENSSEFQEFL